MKSGTFILVAITLFVAIGMGVYLASNGVFNNKETIVNNAIMQNDIVKKESVNYINSLIKQYFEKNGVYPRNLIDLKSIFNINDSELERYSRPPFYFTSNGITYEYYAKLNNGEIFKGDTKGIDKNLDASVQVDVNQIVVAVNTYYSTTKRLPKNLEELSTLPDLSFFKVKNNPVTNKPYTYIPKSDGIGFIVSGTLSNGSEYKQEIP